jgi:hypothetical protein
LNEPVACRHSSFSSSSPSGSGLSRVHRADTRGVFLTYGAMRAAAALTSSMLITGSVSPASRMARLAYPGKIPAPPGHVKTCVGPGYAIPKGASTAGRKRGAGRQALGQALVAYLLANAEGIANLARLEASGSADRFK